MNKKRAAAALLVSALLGMLLAACGGKKEKTESLDRPDAVIAVEIDTPMEDAVRARYPKARLLYLYSPADLLAAVRSGRADACAIDRSIFETAVRQEVAGLTTDGEPLGEGHRIVVGVSHKAQVPDAEQTINAFLDEMDARGVLEEMYRRWVTDGDYKMPPIAAPEAPAQTIRVATTGLLEPYTFYQGDTLTGYDIELLRRFALWANQRSRSMCTARTVFWRPRSPAGRIMWYPTCTTRPPTGTSWPYRAPITRWTPCWCAPRRSRAARIRSKRWRI